MRIEDCKTLLMSPNLNFVPLIPLIPKFLCVEGLSPQL